MWEEVLFSQIRPHILILQGKLSPPRMSHLITSGTACTLACQKKTTAWIQNINLKRLTFNFNTTELRDNLQETKTVYFRED